MIRAQSADGVIHEFPDGTKQAVIDGAMQAYAQSKAPLTTKVARYAVKEVGGAISGAVDKLQSDYTDYNQTRQQRPKSVGDFLTQPWKETAATGKLALDTAGVALSPLAGAVHGAVVTPAVNALNAVPLPVYTNPNPLATLRGEKPQLVTGDARRAELEKTVNMSLMGLGPGRGGAPAAAVVSRPNPFAENVAASERAGVRPTMAAARGSGSASVTKAVAENPLAGAVVRKRLQGSLSDTANAVDRVAGQYGTSLPPASAGEVVQTAATRFSRGTGANVPPDVARTLSSQRMSFGDKASSLYTRTERLIGDSSKKIPLRQTTKAVGEAMTAFDDPNLAHTFRNGVLNAIGEDLTSAGGHVSWRDAMRLRSSIRQRLMSDPELRGTMSDAQINGIYSALTQDIAEGAAKLGGPEARRAWQQANDYYAQGQARINDHLTKFYSAPSGEAAFDTVVRSAGSKGGADVGRLLALKRSMQPAEWGDLSASVVKRLGQPTSGSAEALSEAPFSVSSFVTNYAKLSERGRAILFGSVGGGGEKASRLQAELDNLAKVADLQKNVERAANASRTGTVVQTGATFAGILNPATAIPTAKVLGGMALTGEMLTNPAIVRWLSRLASAGTKGSEALNAQVRALGSAAKQNAVLLPLAQQARLLTSAPAPSLALPIAAKEKQQQKPPRKMGPG